MSTVEALRLGTLLFLVLGAVACWAIVWLWDKRRRGR
jgi:hypothetical protein